MKRTNDYLIEGAMVIIGTLVATGVGVAFNAAKEAACELVEKIRERGEDI